MEVPPVTDKRMEGLERNANRYIERKDEWRRSAIVSLTVGNGGGLAALAAWSGRLDDFDQAMSLFLPGMWMFTVGLLGAGALPFAAWWNAYALSEVTAGRRDKAIAYSIESNDEDGLTEREVMIARAESRIQTRRLIALSHYLLRLLLVLSGACFVTGTVSTLWTVSRSDGFSHSRPTSRAHPH